MSSPVFPLRRAWIGVLTLLPLVVAAFWPRYFAVIGQAPWQLHVHALGSTAWVILIAAQGWLIDRRHVATHRAAGRAVFLAAPLFLAGAMLVVQTQGDGIGAFHQLFGSSLAVSDALTTLLLAFLIGGALATRAVPARHARYMLATLLPLLSPIFARLFSGVVPGLTIRSLADLPRFGTSIHVANAMTVLLCLVLFRGAPRHGRPFLIVGAVTIVQSVLFQLLLGVEAVANVTAAAAALPPALFGGAGLALGAVACAAGWRMQPVRERTLAQREHPASPDTPARIPE